MYLGQKYISGKTGSRLLHEIYEIAKQNNQMVEYV